MRARQKAAACNAGRAFAVGEMVEEAAVLILRTTPYAKLPVELKRLVFDWGNLSGKMDSATAIALGYGTLYNSANPANMRYEASVEQETLRFIAVRDIAGDPATHPVVESQPRAIARSALCPMMRAQRVIDSFRGVNSLECADLSALWPAATCRCLR